MCKSKNDSSICFNMTFCLTNWNCIRDAAELHKLVIISNHAWHYSSHKERCHWWPSLTDENGFQNRLSLIHNSGKYWIHISRKVNWKLMLHCSVCCTDVSFHPHQLHNLETESIFLDIHIHFSHRGYAYISGYRASHWVTFNLVFFCDTTWWLFVIVSLISCIQLLLS